MQPALSGVVGVGAIGSMAVDFNAVKLLFWAKNLGASFERTLTLGHQGLVCSPRRFRRTVADFGLAATRDEIDRCFHRLVMGPLYADSLLRFLGAKEVVSVDKSDFESATLLHDLNDRFPESEWGRSDFVFDGGTLEHIFNYPAALLHCLELVRVGGHFLTITPAHNLMGHGFYQISPELFFRVFCPPNGFVLRKIVLFDSSQTDADFFQVNDPAGTGRRTELAYRRPMLLAALAQRTANGPLLNLIPQQSDYVSNWEKHRQESVADAPTRAGTLDRLRKRLNPYWPFWLRRWKDLALYYRQRGSIKLHSSEHFRRLAREEVFRERSAPVRQ